MTPQFRSFCLAAMSAAILALGSAAPGQTQPASSPATAQAARPPSAEDFGREAAIRGVNISPDGKHIAAITSPDGKTPYVTIWRTDQPEKPPVHLACNERATCQGVSFIKNDRLLVTVRQTWTTTLTQGGGTQKRHLILDYITDIEGKSWRLPFGESINEEIPATSFLLDSLPNDPRSILVGKRSPFSGSTDIYKIDVYTNAARRLYIGSEKYGEEQTDLDGEIRARQSVGFENGAVYLAQWIRAAGSSQWVEHFRWYAKDREPKEVVGFTTDPNIIYVRSNAGRDKSAVYEYDVAARKFLEPVFEHKLFDAGYPVFARDGRVLGFRYQAETSRIYWTDEKMAGLEKGLRQAMGIKTIPVRWTDTATGEESRYATPDGVDIRIADWSDDMRYIVAVKTGPRQPAEYYLLTDGVKLTLLGKSRPWFDTTTLGDTRLVQYRARDGLMIPGILTTPRKEIYGPGPYPTIIHPHGGPWGRDSMGWDGSGWVQYFASRGYAVLQPQFRGSEGWGQKLWRAGDAQWGLTMQDDKDDGAKWLIAQGIAAPDRIAMHGYSYGGYAAMAASVRPNGLYQCAVAGAGVASVDRFRELINKNRFGREFQLPAVDGMSPIRETDKVSIPVFLYHGDRDITVPIEESERFVNALRSAGKPVKFLMLKDMGHQYILWEAGQTGEVLAAIDDYLRTECGPGGL